MSIKEKLLETGKWSEAQIDKCLRSGPHMVHAAGQGQFRSWCCCRYIWRITSPSKPRELRSEEEVKRRLSEI